MTITTIDNNQRVFVVIRKGFSTRHWFCNLKDIPNVIRNALEPHDQYIVKEFWNGNFRRCGKGFLNEMFEANQIDFKIK